MDHRTIGLLPDEAVVAFIDACAGLFIAPVVERDLLKVPNSSLVEVVNFGAASVSAHAFALIYFLYFFTSRFVISHLDLQAMLLAQGL